MINIRLHELLSIAILATWTATGVTAQVPAQKSFTSASEASQNLYDAVQSNNLNAIVNILGGPTELASTQDDLQDKVDRDLFAQKYQEMHRVGLGPNGTRILYIGAQNWPFPIPLISSNGTWRFDPDAGMKEVLFRRIGDNELTAIATCHDFVHAEQRYPATSSDDPTASSPVSLVAKAASASPAANPVLFHGYYFRLLSRGPKNGAGAFTFIAYPAEYRSSGVETFIVLRNGVVYEKDLGTNTSSIASAMTSFHRDSSWRVAEK